MKDQLASLLRHTFTGWILAAVVFLTAKLSLSAEDVKAVETALNQIGAGLLLLIVTLAPVIGRLVWSWGAQIFQRGAGETKAMTDDKTGLSGGVGLILTMTGAAAVLMGGLPSCSPGQLGSMPIRAKILTPQGNLVYSSKGGLEVEVDASSAK